MWSRSSLISDRGHISTYFAITQKYIMVTSLSLVQYLTTSMILFIIGIGGIYLHRKNILIMIMSVELMLLAVNLNWILFSVFLDDIVGQIMSFFVLTVAAAESAIGLGILVIYYRVRNTIDVEYISLLRN